MTMLLDQLDNYNIYVTAIQAVRRLGTSIIVRVNHTIYYSCHDKQHVAGTGFIVSRRAKQLVTGLKTKNPRIYLRI